MGDLRQGLALLFAAAAAIGVLLAATQVVVLWRHLRRAPPPARRRPPISILKPLCGVDDQLAENLRAFADLPYPEYEVLLGVRSVGDPAYPFAAAALARWPARFRVVVQRRSAGLNPKVNQLSSLSEAARFPLIVISDSNTRVRADYLEEIAAHLGDERVGLVTHPIAGRGDDEPGARLGSRLDNLHLTGTITPGIAAAGRLCGKTYVVGKSMAMWRRDVEALGGFRAVENVLAEDFVLGRLFTEVLGKRVVLARSVVECVSVQRSVAAFVRRYGRWSVMQRQCAGMPAYLGMLLLNPVLLALAALASRPAPATAALLLGCAAARAVMDGASGRLLRGRGGFGARALLAVAAWGYGLVRRSIDWRDTRLRVSRGSRLSPARPRSARGIAGSGRARASAAA
jgi:ceramide glucosyltransferase